MGIGELAVAKSGLLATHALGSCVAVCLWDVSSCVGGLIHIMLPAPSSRRKERPALYATTGIPMLLNEMRYAGANLQCTTARLVGGSSVAGTSMFAVGRRNVMKARQTLYSQRIVVSAEDVGGRIPRSVRLRVADGQVLVTSPDRAQLVL
ncbi:MAG: chemotaxis protein CheD [Myxococcales bacterium]|nr:chemotaxis protein CheD [Myxococcales bacterium]